MRTTMISALCSSSRPPWPRPTPGSLACQSTWDVFDTSACIPGETEVTSVAADDGCQDLQFELVVSFDASSIPDGATTVSANLRLRRGTLIGTNPFTILGTCYADNRSGGLNGSMSLEPTDFRVAATASQVATMSNPTTSGAWSEGVPNASGLAAINKTGTTQLRVPSASSTPTIGATTPSASTPATTAAPDNRPRLAVTSQ